jgi:hypothetical protein
VPGGGRSRETGEASSAPGAVSRPKMLFLTTPQPAETNVMRPTVVPRHSRRLVQATSRALGHATCKETVERPFDFTCIVSVASIDHNTSITRYSLNVEIQCFEYLEQRRDQITLVDVSTATLRNSFPFSMLSHRSI